MAKKLMECIKEPSSNQHFENPYKKGEKVIYLGEVEPRDDSESAKKFAKNFIRIKRIKPLEERVETRTDFKFI